MAFLNLKATTLSGHDRVNDALSHGTAGIMCPLCVDRRVYAAGLFGIITHIKRVHKLSTLDAQRLISANGHQVKT